MTPTHHPSLFDFSSTEIILVDKPVGITSFDVIRTLRRYSGIKKMGHAGTLDPLASGLMIVGIGKGTKRLHSLIKLPKTYDAEILIGAKSTTGDKEGRITETKPVPLISLAMLEAVCARIEGEHTLPVSPYSAIKKDGIPYYKRARKAEQKGEILPEYPLRTMRVQNVTLASATHHSNSITLRVIFDVESGTYIRSLGEEIGRLLGYPAMLTALRRTKIGKWSIEDNSVMRL